MQDRRARLLFKHYTTARLVSRAVCKSRHSQRRTCGVTSKTSKRNNTKMSERIVWPAVGAVIFPNLGGWVGGFITRKYINPWYESLRKPDWRPPNWAFGPIWTSLYCGMGYASYLVWRDGGGFAGEASQPLALYGVNIALNWAWTPIFFGAKSLKWSFYEILLVWGSTAVTMVSFYHVNKTAGYLFIPYLAWGTLATALNYAIYRDNPTPAIEDKKD